MCTSSGVMGRWPRWWSRAADPRRARRTETEPARCLNRTTGGSRCGDVPAGTRTGDTGRCAQSGSSSPHDWYSAHTDGGGGISGGAGSVAALTLNASAEGQAAVHDQRLPGDEPAAAGAQEGDHRREVARLLPAGDRPPGGRGREVVVVVERPR